jgi:hypothetical protein
MKYTEKEEVLWIRQTVPTVLMLIVLWAYFFSLRERWSYCRIRRISGRRDVRNFDLIFNRSTYSPSDRRYRLLVET